MELATHLRISASLVGRVTEIAPMRSVVVLETTAEMTADERDLVHGGFVFGLADFAAMAAVNDPNVVLGAADVRFLAPVTVGEVLSATASVEDGAAGKKRVVDVSVTAKRNGREVFAGRFTCFVLDRHVLDRDKEST